MSLSEKEKQICKLEKLNSFKIGIDTYYSIIIYNRIVQEM